MNRELLIALIKSKAIVSGHSTWEGGYYYLANAEQIADAIIASIPPPISQRACSDCINCGCKR